MLTVFGQRRPTVPAGALGPCGRFIGPSTSAQRRKNMGARNKLNSAYFLGSLLMAGLAGCLTESWLVLIIGLAVLVGINVNNGDIRLDKRKGR
jgi:hypothetical protein